MPAEASLLISLRIKGMKKQWARPFSTIWSVQALSLFASELVCFALIWWLTSTTRSARVLATSSLAGMLPQVVIGPLAGALVDRWNRRQVMIVADSCIAAATLLLAIIYISGHLQPWHVYVLMFVRSAAGGFHWPAMAASTSLMVPDEHLARVAGMNQALRGASSILTPPLGALLLSALPLHGILAIDVVTALIAVSPLLFISVPQPKQALEGPVTVKAVLLDMRDGWRYLTGWPAFLGLVITATLINLFLNPAFSLLPILVTNHLHGAALQLAWLNSVFGSGLIAGGVILSAWGGFKRKILTFVLGLWGMGLGCVAIGWTATDGFAQALVGMALVGAFMPICNGPFQALMQSRVEPAMQGRIFGLVGSLANLASPLSMVIAGPLSDALGVSLWYKIGGVACIVLGSWPLFVASVRNIDRLPAGGTAQLASEPLEH
jgi:DHA3 family macrolide efflux protein-like MFS transporter